MAQSPTINLVRRGYAAFNTADIATLTEVIAPDAVQKVPGNSRLSGEFKGRDAILGFYAAVAQQTEGTFQASLEDLYEDTAGSVAAIHHAMARRAGKTLDLSAALVFQIVNDKAEEMLGLSADLEAENEFWGGTPIDPRANLGVVRRAYAGIGAGDVEALTELMSKDVTMFLSGHNHFSGMHRGRDTLFTVLAESADETDSTYEISLETLYADGEGHVLAIQHEKGSKEGRHLDVRHALLMQILNATIVDIHDFSADPSLDDAFWG